MSVRCKLKGFEQRCQQSKILNPEKGYAEGLCVFAGHSLGGALANLCAFDIAAAIKEAGATDEGGHRIEVSCYTFGAPRTGNTAFQSEYNVLVPDSWAVINDQVPPPAVGTWGGGWWCCGRGVGVWRPRMVVMGRGGEGGELPGH